MYQLDFRMKIGSGFQGLLPTTEIETGELPEYVMIWLHGLGADGNDFVPIVDQLNLPLSKSIRFVFPHAPEQPITINKGYVMRAWYDIKDSNFNVNEDELGIRHSQKAIEALIEREIESGIATERIIVAGFSQGGVIALQTGLRYAKPLAGILALSCYLSLSASLVVEVNRRNLAIPIFMAHGIGDDVIPLSYAVESKKIIKAIGYTPEWHDYPMAHSVCNQELRDISRWIQAVFS